MLNLTVLSISIKYKYSNVTNPQTFFIEAKPDNEVGLGDWKAPEISTCTNS